MPAGGTDLRHYVRVYDGDLPADLCARMLAAFAQAHEHQVVREHGWRDGLEQSAWVELDITPLADAALIGFFSRQIAVCLRRYNADVGLPIAIPESTLLAPLRIKRYRPGADEAFQLHFDSIGEVANRYLVCLWYLNDVAEGGETEFPGLGIKVAPRAGRLLMFPPFWMYPHAGRLPISGDKFILSTYLKFRMQPDNPG